MPSITSMLELRVPPPIQLMAFGVLMWGTAKLVPDASFRLPAWPWISVLSLVAGLAFAVAGMVEFRRAETTVDPLNPDKASALVTGGVYRFTRNPMYVGLLLILTGWGAYLGSWVGLLGLPLFCVYITRFQIQPEERVMANKFGDAYADYQARVQRWL